MKLKKNEYLLTTDANTLRSYLSHGAIYANEIIDSGHYEISASNIDDRLLIISKNPLLINIDDMLKTENVFPIILKLTFNSTILNTLEILHFNSNYYKSKKLLKNVFLAQSNSLFCMIPGFIALNYLSRIYFENTDDVIRFTYSMDNLHYPEELFEVNSDLFNERDTLKIDSKFGHRRPDFTEYENVEQITKFSKLRYKLQGAFLGALTGYGKSIGRFEVKFNRNDLDLIDVDEIVKKQAVTSLVESFGYISSHDKDKIIESAMIKEDASIYANIGTFFQLLIHTHVFGQKLNYSDFLKRYIPQNIVFYHVMCELFDHHYMSNFSPTQFISNVISRILDDEILTIEDKIEQELILRYIQNYILTDLKSINESLEGANHPEKSLSRALMIFLKTPFFNMHDQLKSNISSFSILPEDERLIWILFGLLNGFAAFPAHRKNSPVLCRYIDAYVDAFMSHPMLATVPNDIDLFKSYRNCNSDPFVFEDAFPLFIIDKNNEIEKPILELHKLIKSLSDSRKNEFFRFLKKQINDNLTLFDDSINYVLRIEKNSILKSWDDDKYLNTRVTSAKKVQITRDIQGYLEMIINDFGIFSKEYLKNEKFWKNIRLEILGL
jgi:hypothetical protein